MCDAAGIDFGNKTCVMGVYSGDHSVDIVLSPSSARSIPASVTITPERRYAGEASQTNQMQYINSTITQMKRLIGLKYSSEDRQQISDFTSLNLAELTDGNTGVKVTYHEKEIVIRPEQFIAYLLKDLAKNIHSHSPQVNSYVISISPWWSDAHRRVMVDACKIAGLNCQSLVNSTTAAAVAYAINHEERLPRSDAEPAKVAFIDFGDHSMNVAVASVKQGFVKMNSFAYDDRLGGSLFTTTFIPYLLDRTAQKYGIDTKTSPRAMLRFMQAAEKLKKTLSINQIAPFEVQNLMNDTDVSFLVKREDFNKAIEPLISRITPPIEKALNLAKVTKNELFAVELLGGGSRVPRVKEVIAQFFGKEPTQTLNLDECFAVGAGFIASKSDTLEVTDAYPFQITATWSEGAAEKTFEAFAQGCPIPSEISFSGHGKIDFISEGIKIGTVVLDSEEPVSLTMKLNQSGILEVVSAKRGNEDVTFHFTSTGGLTEDSLHEAIELEEEMSASDQKEIQIDEARNDFEGALFSAEASINRDDKEYYDPDTIESQKQKIAEQRKWFEENEFERKEPTEYRTRIEALKEVTKVPKSLKESYANYNAEATKLKAELSKLTDALKADPERNDDGLKEELMNNCANSAKLFESVVNNPKYKEQTVQTKQMSDKLAELKAGLKKLRTFPMRPKERKQQYDFWGNPIQKNWGVQKPMAERANAEDGGEEEEGENEDPWSALFGGSQRQERIRQQRIADEIRRREEEAAEERRRRRQEQERLAEIRRRAIAEEEELRKRRLEEEQERMRGQWDERPFSYELKRQSSRGDPRMVDPRSEFPEDNQEEYDWGLPLRGRRGGWGGFPSFF